MSPGSRYGVCVAVASVLVGMGVVADAQQLRAFVGAVAILAAICAGYSLREMEE